MSSFSWPPSGVIVTEYDSYSDFPVTDNDGAIAIALDTDVIYIYNLPTTSWKILNDGVGVAQYPTFSDFPNPASDGQLALALDDNALYSFNLGDLAWVVIGGGSSSLGLTAFGSSPSPEGASLSGQDLTLQPADATNPGGIAVGRQTFSGDKKILGDGNSPVLTLDNSTTASGSVGFVVNQKANSTNNAATATIMNADGNPTCYGHIRLFETGAVDGNGTLFGELDYLTADGANHPYYINQMVAVNPGITGLLAAQLSGPNVYPVVSIPATLTDAQYAWAYDSNTDTYSDISSGNHQVFINQNDQIYIGSSSPFVYIQVWLDIVASADIQSVCEYYTGSNWVAFESPMLFQNFTENNPGPQYYLLNNSSFSNSSATVNSQEGYYIRITRTVEVLDTPPTISHLYLSPFSTFSYWDKDNNLRINELETLSAVTVGADINCSFLTSTIATGTPPLVVASTTKVDNLHVEAADVAGTVAFEGERLYEIDAYGSSPATIIYQNILFGASNYDSVTGEWTAPVDGFVNVFAKVTANNVTNLNLMVLTIVKNGIAASNAYGMGSAGGPGCLQISDIVQVAANDVILIQGYCGTGSAVPNTGIAGCTLSIAYAGV